MPQELAKMSKKDMLVLAKTLGVGCQGSKAVLTKRLRKARKSRC